MALLECQHPTNAQHETVELQQFGGFLLVSSKTMEHATWQFIAVGFQQIDHLILCLPTMNHQRQTRLDAPFHLLFEGSQLLVLKFATPVEVESHLADGNELTAIGIEHGFHLSEHRRPVGPYFLGMKSYHGIGKARKAAAYIEHSGYRWKMDGGNKDTADTCLAGTCHHLGEVVEEFFTV